MSTPINIAVTDNFLTGGLQDSQTASQPYSVLFTDTISLSDSASPFGLLQFGDAVTLSDNISISGPGSVDNEGDGLSLSDTIKDILGLDVISGASDDLISLNDNLDSVIVGILEAFSDSYTLSDSISLAGPGISEGLSDAISLSDGQIVELDILSTFTESLTISDSFSTMAPDALGIGDSSDVLNLQDGISIDEGTGAINITMQASLSLSDSETILLGEGYGFTGDTLALSDLTKALETGILTPADSLALSDLLRIDSPITGLDVSDGLLFTESLRLEYELQIGNSLDELNLLDSVSLNNLVVDPQVSDTYSLTDLVVINLTHTLFETPSDSLSLTDFIVVTREPLPESFNDSLNLSDNISIYNAANLPYTFNDSLVLSDGSEEAIYTDFIDYLRRYLNDVPN